MKLTKAVPYLFAASIFVPALSWADAALDASLAPVTAATTTMGRCTAISNNIATGKFPAGHARANMLLAANAQEKDPAKRLPVDPMHQKFDEWIGSQTQRLAACGKVLSPQAKAADDALGKLADTKPSDADAAQIVAVADKYQAAKEALVASIEKLSEDKQTQAYVHQALLDEFLK